MVTKAEEEIWVSKEAGGSRRWCESRKQTQLSGRDTVSDTTDEPPPEGDKHFFIPSTFLLGSEFCKFRTGSKKVYQADSAGADNPGFFQF